MANQIVDAWSNAGSAARENATGSGQGYTRDEILEKLLLKGSKITYNKQILNYGEGGQLLLRGTYDFFYSLIVKVGNNPSLDINEELEKALGSNPDKPNDRLGVNFLKEFCNNQNGVKGLSRQRLFQGYKTFKNYVVNHINYVLRRNPKHCVEWHEKALNLALHFSSFAARHDVPVINGIYERYCARALELKKTGAAHKVKPAGAKQLPVNGMRKAMKQIILDARKDKNVMGPKSTEERMEDIRKFLTDNYSKYAEINAYLNAQSPNYKSTFINKLALLISCNYGRINELFLEGSAFSRQLTKMMLELEGMRVFKPIVSPRDIKEIKDGAPRRSMRQVNEQHGIPPGQAATATPEAKARYRAITNPESSPEGQKAADGREERAKARTEMRRKR